MLKILKWFGIAVGVLLVAVLVTVVGAATFTTLPGERATPSGLMRNQALYVEMSDGVQIAIDIWLPEDYEAGQELPTMLYMTRYWRADAVGPLQRAAIALGLAGTGDLPKFPARAFNSAGYAFIEVDARGSGASFGTRPIEWSPEELRDYGELATWITEQDWSNGEVGAIGISYNGNTAELITVANNPAVRAVAPLYNDFDPQYGLTQPGGAFNAYLDRWGWAVGRQDHNDICALVGADGIMCWLTKLWTPGVKPVDEDRDGSLLAAAIAEHEANANVTEAFEDVAFRDDHYGDTNYTVADIAPYGYREEIEASGTPMQLWLGWLDAATTDGALSRYLTFTNAQQLIIGPYSHGGFRDTDPFEDPARPVQPSIEDQWREMIAFFDDQLSDNPTAFENSIRYYTLGSGEWRETNVWPPVHVSEETLYFAADGTLSEDAPTVSNASDAYTVDFEVTTGNQTRWHTNMGGGDVVYPDQAEMDQRRLTYTTAPLPADLEITGSPVLTFYVDSTTSGNVFHAYLEAVAPDGRVTYITEGVLRGIHRRISDAEPVYAQHGPYHSFLRADAEPMVPGEVTEIAITLYATSVVIPEGSSLRIALAGADQSMFRRWPEDETPEWNVHRSAAYPSHVTFPADLRSN